MRRPGTIYGGSLVEEFEMRSNGRSRRPSDPWFRTHPEAAAAVIIASSFVVVVLQALQARASDAIALLYVLPISLAAVTFGMVGGLTAAMVAYLAFGLFAALSPAGHVGLDGWVGRAAAMFLLGGLLGRASDQTERATGLALAHQRQRLVAEEQSRRFAEGIELSDSILQEVTAAKWAIEQGDHARAARLLGQALSSGQEMVGELLPSRSVDASTGVAERGASADGMILAVRPSREQRSGATASLSPVPPSAMPSP